MDKTMFMGLTAGVVIVMAGGIGLMIQPQVTYAQINCQGAVEETHNDRVFLIEYCDDGAYMTDTVDGSRVFLNERNCSISGDDRIIISSCMP